MTDKTDWAWIGKYNDLMGKLRGALNTLPAPVDDDFPEAKFNMEAALQDFHRHAIEEPRSRLGMPYRSDLPMREFQDVNWERAQAWHKDGEEWSLADWGNAMAGECGEACNVIKKMRRIETGTGGNTKGEQYDQLRMLLGKEIADTVTYAFLLASVLGVDLQTHIIEKFNEVSDKQGLPQKLRHIRYGEDPRS